MTIFLLAVGLQGCGGVKGIASVGYISEYYCCTLIGTPYSPACCVDSGVRSISLRDCVVRYGTSMLATLVARERPFHSLIAVLLIVKRICCPLAPTLVLFLLQPR